MVRVLIVEVMFDMDSSLATMAFTRLLIAAAISTLVALLVYSIALEVSIDSFNSLYARAKWIWTFFQVYWFTGRCFHSRASSLNSPDCYGINTTTYDLCGSERGVGVRRKICAFFNPSEGSLNEQVSIELLRRYLLYFFTVDLHQ